MGKVLNWHSKSVIIIIIINCCLSQCSVWCMLYAIKGFISFTSNNFSSFSILLSLFLVWRVEEEWIFTFSSQFDTSSSLSTAVLFIANIGEGVDSCLPSRIHMKLPSFHFPTRNSGTASGHKVPHLRVHLKNTRGCIGGNMFFQVPVRRYNMIQEVWFE